MKIDYKEVDFKKYCNECKHKDTPETHDPCNECLDNPMNLETSKPINYSEKKGETNHDQK